MTLKAPNNNDHKFSLKLKFFDELHRMKSEARQPRVKKKKDYI